MIIDTHSHIGNDYYCGNIKLEDYVSFCYKMGIDIGFLMPTPWPTYKKDGVNITSLLWEHYDFKYRNYFQLANGIKSDVIVNPYEYINQYYYNQISLTDSKIKIYFIPLIHGILDKPEYIESLIKKTNPKAVKMHGFGSGFSPADINPDITELFRYYNIPIILHTSVYNYDYGYGADTKYWRNECHPLKWANYLLSNKLHGVLNHGACLNEESIQLVNRNDDLMIGIGPDLDISKDYFKIDMPKEKYFQIEYLKYLKKYVMSDRLLFDIDYSWNTNPDTNEIDYNSVERVEEIWSLNEKDKILSKNAQSFFKL